MAKRANPFVEDFVQQSKVHVGLKQFNNNEHRLQKVYEKTLDMLFRGAKKPMARIAPTVAGASAPLAKKDNMKQLCIGKDGALSRLEMVPEQQCPNLMEQSACGCCCAPAEERCGYCERRLCAACAAARRCRSCAISFCEHCSLVGADMSTVCVSCYS